MAPKPDLGSMALTKAKAAGTVPFSAAEAPPTVRQPPPPPTAGESKSLTIKLSAADYARLRDLCIERERELGRRVTHQEVMVEAFHALLGNRREVA